MRPHVTCSICIDHQPTIFRHHLKRVFFSSSSSFYFFLFAWRFILNENIFFCHNLLETICLFMAKIDGLTNAIKCFFYYYYYYYLFIYLLLLLLFCLTKYVLHFFAEYKFLKFHNNIVGPEK